MSSDLDMAGAGPGFSNGGGAKYYVDAAHIPWHNARSSLYGRGLGARLRALETLCFYMPSYAT